MPPEVNYWMAVDEGGFQERPKPGLRLGFRDAPNVIASATLGRPGLIDMTPKLPL